MNNWQDMVRGGRHWLAQTSPATRGWLIIGILGLVLAIGWLCQSGNQNQPVKLFTSRDLSNDEIGMMELAFGNAELNDYEVREGAIWVPRWQRPDYLKALREYPAIPADLVAHRQDSTIERLFPSRYDQRQKQLDQKRRRIRDMVQQLSFVQHAMVDYDEAKSATPFSDLQRAAIVTIKPNSFRKLDPPEIKAVRDLVSGAVAGLKPSDVIVTDTHANRSYSGAHPFPSELVRPLAQVKNLEEAIYEQKIRNALEAYPGIRVIVEVVIDPVLHRRLDQRQVDSEPTVVSKTFQRETYQPTQPIVRPSGPTHMSAGTNSRIQLPSWAGQTDLTRSMETTESVASGTFETKETAGLTVRSVRVSIGIAERCIDHLACRQFPGVQELAEHGAPAVSRHPRFDEVFTRVSGDIRQKVKPLLPQSQPSDEHIVVTVDPQIPYDLDGDSSESTAALTETGWFANHWSTLAMIALGLLALLALLVLRGRLAFAQDDRSPMAESTHTDPAPNSGSIQPVATIDINAPGIGPHDANQEIQRQLDQWRRQNPDVATASIRQWLEKAG